MARLESDRAVERIWSGDASFWKVEAVQRRRIEESLGWLTLVERGAAALPALERFAYAAREETDRVLVLGAGGAASAARLFAGTFAPVRGYPALEVLDSTEPSAVAAAAARSDPSRTLFVVSSPSGRELETALLFDAFYEHAREELGARAGDRFLAITEPGSALETEAVSRGVRKVLPSDPRVPGRYGALTNFGLVPAALTGVDLRELFTRSFRMVEACRAGASENPGALLGAALAAESLSGHDKLTFSVDAPLAGLVGWLEPLIAGSTGKEGRGIVPVEGEPLGGPGVYGFDRLFVRYDTQGFEDAAASRRIGALLEHGHPVVSFSVRDPLDLGGEVFRWEFAAVAAAHLLAVNPFDEPDSGEAEAGASAMLADSTVPVIAEGVSEEELSRLLGSVLPGGYFALTAYLRETPETAAALQEIRLRVRDARRVATCVGFGPRSLHATGQLSRGGPPGGVFLQIVGEPSESFAIPGRPWGFSEVVAAQASADRATLALRGRRVARVSLPQDVARGLRELSGTVEKVLAQPGRAAALRPEASDAFEQPPARSA